MGCGESAQACFSPASQPTASLPPVGSGWGTQVTEQGWGQSILLSYTGRLSSGQRPCTGQSGSKYRKKVPAQPQNVKRSGLLRQCPETTKVRGKAYSSEGSREVGGFDHHLRHRLPTTLCLKQSLPRRAQPLRRKLEVGGEHLTSWQDVDTDPRSMYSTKAPRGPWRILTFLSIRSPTA